MTLGLPTEGKREWIWGPSHFASCIPVQTLSVLFSCSISLLNDNNYYALSAYYRFHTQYSACITFNPGKNYVNLEEGEWCLTLSCTPTEERPCEDKERRRLSEIQEEKLSPESGHAVTLILGFQPPELEEIHFCYVSHPVYEYFVSLSWWMQLLYPSEPLSSVSGYFLWPQQQEFFTP